MRSSDWDNWVAKARAVRIEDEVARRGIKLNGGRVERCRSCPRCGGDDRFSINTRKQVFNCRGCGAKGDVIALVELLDATDFVHAVETLTGEQPPKVNGKHSNEDTQNGGGKAWTLISEHIYLDEHGERYLKVKKCLDGNGKRQFPQFHWDGNTWTKGKPRGPKVSYRLPELIAAPVTATVFFCEGEKDADNVAKLGFVATTASEGAAAKWDDALTPYFKDRRVVVLVDADKPGRAHGQKVAKAINGVAASVRILDLFPDRHDGSDVSNWLEDDTAGAKLAQLAKSAPLWELSADGEDDSHGDTGGTDDELITELAALSRLTYAKRRKDAAEKIGITVGELDKIVAKARSESEDKEPSPALYEHWKVEAADEPVEAGILLRALSEAIRRYVFLSDDQTVAVVLWIVFSWLHEQATHSPILFVTSAEKDSGKSTLLGVVNFLARRSLQSVDITGAALFRSIAKWRPTLIVDEADDALADNVDLRSGINSGWTRGQGVIRCHPDTHEPELFSTFAPKVVGMKGRNLPDTTLSRSIVIAMRPRRPKDPKEDTADFSHCDTEAFAGLRSRLMRLAADQAEALARAEPEIPADFHNRRRANWKPLLAIADLAGGDYWPARARAAALAIEAAAATFDPSVGLQLLQGVKEAFEARGVDRITSAGLITDLASDETGPWATYNKGKPISQRQVAKLLKPYEIKPGTIRLDDGSTPKGYLFAWFKDVFERFCPSNIPSSPETPISIRHAATDLFSHNFLPISSATPHCNVADKKDEKQFHNNDVAVWRIEKPPGAEEGNVGVSDIPSPPPSEPCAERGAKGPAPGPEHPAAEDLPAPADEDRSCRQCDGPLDGTEQLCALDDGAAVWLHPECQPHYLDRVYR